MSRERQVLGKLGEDIAVKFLRKRHYKILERNFRFSRLGEIDIIGRDQNGQLVFFEVKTKKSKNFGLPEQEFTYFKRKKIENLVKLYLSKKYPEEEDWRLDVIAIEIIPPNKAKIFHYIAV